MANGAYAQAKAWMISGALNITTGSWYAYLFGTGYTVDLFNHATVADLGLNVIGSPQLLASPYVALGPPQKGGFNDPIFSSVTMGVTVKGIVIAKGSGISTDQLAFYFDTGTGLPFTGTGGSLTVEWNGGSTSGDIIQF